MKKKILSVALIALSLVSFSGVAQTVNNDNSVQTENVRKARSDKKGNRPQKSPYEGLTLSDSQKAKLEQLDSKRKAAREQQMAERKEKKQQAKEMKMQDRKARMEARKADKKAYLEEVKAIIGPDQYVVFLENFYVNGGDQGAKHAKMDGRHDKNGKKDKHDGKHFGKDSKKDQRGSKEMKKSDSNSKEYAKKSNLDKKAQKEAKQAMAATTASK